MLEARRWTLGGVLLSVFLCAQPYPAHASTGADISPEAARAIDTYAARFLHDERSPALSLALVRRGDILYARGYGYADLADKVPATAHTKYEIGSLSKQFTAAAVLLLVEDHKLSLGDRIGGYFPRYSGAQGVTIRQLLTHTSGIPEYNRWSWKHDLLQSVREGGYTFDPVIDRLAKRPLDFPPGSAYHYSNTNYLLAALIVQKRSGERFDAFLKRRIFDPLALHDTHSGDSEAAASGRAIGYSLLGPVRVRAMTWELDWMLGCAGITSSAIDLAKWNLALFGGRVITRASLREMLSSPHLPGANPNHYGLGLIFGPLKQYRAIWHSGRVGGFTSEYIQLRDEGVALYELTNQDATEPGVRAILRAVVPTSPPGVPRRGWYRFPAWVRSSILICLAAIALLALIAAIAWGTRVLIRSRDTRKRHSASAD